MSSPDDPTREQSPEEQPAEKACKAALIGALTEGEQSGPAVPFDFSSFIGTKPTASRG